MVHLFIDLQYSLVKKKTYDQFVGDISPHIIIILSICKIHKRWSKLCHVLIPKFPQLQTLPSDSQCQSCLSVIEKIEAPGPAWSFCHVNLMLARTYEPTWNSFEINASLPVPQEDWHWLDLRFSAVWYASQLVGGFNPFETYESKWESSPNVWNHHPVKCCLKLTSFWHCGKTPTICSRQLHQAFRKGMHCTSSNHCSAKQYFLEQGTSKSVVILQVQPTFPQDNSHFQNFELPSKLTTSISKVSIKTLPLKQTSEVETKQRRNLETPASPTASPVFRSSCWLRG